MAYVSGDLGIKIQNLMDKAKEYFTIANKKSCGRCFEEDDIKYKEFFINEVIKKGN